MSYDRKRVDSFQTKLNIFLLSKCIKEELNVVSKDEFIRYKINDEDIEVYSGVYCQLIPTDVINSVSVADIDQRIRIWKRRDAGLLNQMKDDYKNSFHEILSREKFNEFASGKKCHYCQITLKDINDLIDQRKIFKKNCIGFSMEVGRKVPNKEYSNDNVVTCCYWCNNAKTDEFNEDEFRVIAEGIKKVWVNRGIQHLRS